MFDGSSVPTREDSTARLLDRLGHHYAAVARCAVGVACAVVAPWSEPPAGIGTTALVAGLFVAWSIGYAVRLWRGSARWWTGVDVLVVAALCLAVPWLDNPVLLAETGGWVVGVAAITVMSSFWHLPTAAAWAATAVISAAYLVGRYAGLGVVVTAGLPPSIWLIVEGGLSMLVWALVRRGGRAADTVQARRLEAQRKADLDTARRRDQRTHWAAVHDTSATTLLMIGNGEIRGTEPWLVAQLERDIAALVGAPLDVHDSGVLDSLRAALAGTPSDPVVECGGPSPGEVQAPSRVTAALVGAATEAVENVRRHSGGAAARVRFEAHPDRIVVTVEDSGRGFDPAACGRGRGLRWSVTDRMVDVGGSARVRSAPGVGTTVSLEWPRA